MAADRVQTLGDTAEAGVAYASPCPASRRIWAADSYCSTINSEVGIKTTTACVCLRAKDGATQQLELQGELVRKMVSIQEEILRKLDLD